MKHDYLSSEITDVNVYESPVCEAYPLVRTQRVICASDTEKVDEEDGEW